MKAGAALLIVVLGLSFIAPSRASAENPLDRALDFVAHVAPDAYLVEAAASAGLDAKAWPSIAHPAFAGLRPSASSDAHTAYKADLRTIYAAAADGYDANDITTGFVARIHDTFAQGQDPSTINDEMWYILAMRATGYPANDTSIVSAATTVRASRCASGGWGYVPGATCGTDMTAMALAALKSAGDDVRGDMQAASFIESMHDANGGFHDNPPLTPMGDTRVSVESTAWAIEAYTLLGEPTDGALTELAGQQLSDGGFPRDWGGTTSDAWSTEQAIPALAPFHHPHFGYVAGAAIVPAAHARESTALSVSGPFDQVEWTIDGAPAQSGSLTFDTASEHTFRVHAIGPRGHWRGAGHFTILSARPFAVIATDIEALRHIPVSLDLGASYDPDGAVVASRIDWGDGNATTDGSPHAFDLPGDRVARVRVQDDAGEWSDDARVTIHVRDRAPLFDAASVPARIVADRIHDVAIAPRASDPDGDPVVIAWDVAGARGSGDATLRFSELGEHPVNVTANDPYGGTTRGTVIVDVRNLAPTLSNVTLPQNATANATLHLAALAADADGPAPNVTWTVGNATYEGGEANATLAAGTYDVSVEARDADGGEARANATLTVREDGAAPETISTGARAPVDIKTDGDPSPSAPLPALVFDTAPASVRVGEAARLVLVPLADATSYRFDFGDANSTAGDDTVARHAWTRPGAFEVRATARAADGRESVATLVIQVAASTAPAKHETPPASASLNATPAPTPRVASQVPSPQGSALPAASARHESPAPWALAPILLAALGARRARDARRARRSSR